HEGLVVGVIPFGIESGILSDARIELGGEKFISDGRRRELRPLVLLDVGRIELREVVGELRELGERLDRDRDFRTRSEVHRPRRIDGAVVGVVLGLRLGVMVVLAYRGIELSSEEICGDDRREERGGYIRCLVREPVDGLMPTVLESLELIALVVPLRRLELYRLGAGDD